MAYCNVAKADSYLLKRAFTSAWKDLPEVEKESYLNLASELIYEYCFFPDSETGEPFRYDLIDQLEEVPEFLAKATAEEALYLVNLGKDPTQADKKTTIGIASTEGTVFDKDFRADILGVNCRSILESNGGMISAEAATGSNVAWGYITK